MGGLHRQGRLLREEGKADENLNRACGPPVRTRERAAKVTLQADRELVASRQFDADAAKDAELRVVFVDYVHEAEPATGPEVGARPAAISAYA